MSKRKVISKWKEIVSKFNRALIPDRGGIVDCVRVKLSNSDYLSETGHSKFRGYKIKKMDKNELEKHQIHYKSDSEELINNKGIKASTIGNVSKGIEDTLAFVMTKDGRLYIAKHSGNINGLDINITHGSFLDDRPVEMAGLIKIAEGKIVEIYDISGHYTPDKLDIYRFIKRIDHDMPNVFLTNSEIKIFGKYSHCTKYSLKKFIDYMEKPSTPSSNIPHYEILRNETVAKLQKSNYKLKTTVFITIDCKQSTILEAIENLSIEQQNKLKQYFKSPNLSIIFKQNHCDKIEVMDSKKLMDIVIYDCSIKALEIVLEAGIFNRKDIQQYKPLKKILSYAKDYVDKECNEKCFEMAKLIVKDKNINDLLKVEGSCRSYEDNSLHILVQCKYVDVNILKTILQHPEGMKLLHQQSSSKYSSIKHTPLELVKDSTISNLMKEALLREKELTLIEDQKLALISSNIEKQELIIQKCEDIFWNVATEIVVEKGESNFESCDDQIIQKLYEEIFKNKGFVQDHPITEEMLYETNVLLLKAIDNAKMIEFKFDNKEIILPQWYNLIIDSNNIDYVIKAYVIQSNQILKTKLGIHKNASIDIIYKKLTNNSLLLEKLISIKDQDDTSQKEQSRDESTVVSNYNINTININGDVEIYSAELNF